MSRPPTELLNLARQQAAAGDVAAAATFAEAGRSFHAARRTNDAIAAWQASIDAAPDGAVLTELAAALDQTGQSDLALKCLDMAVRLAPDHAPTYYQLGRAMHDRQLDSEAENFYLRAAELAPDYGIAYRELGKLLHARGASEYAALALRSALTCLGDDPDIERLLGDAELRLGDFAAGWAHWERRTASAAWRQALAFMLPPDALALPMWRGEAAADGDCLLIHPEPESGHTDDPFGASTPLFQSSDPESLLALSRFVALLAGGGRKFALLVNEEIAELLADALPEVRLIRDLRSGRPGGNKKETISRFGSAVAGEFTQRCSLMSLPALLGQAIPPAPLRVAPDLLSARYWEALLGSQFPPSTVRLALFCRGGDSPLLAPLAALCAALAERHAVFLIALDDCRLPDELIAAPPPNLRLHRLAVFDLIEIGAILGICDGAIADLPLIGQLAALIDRPTLILHRDRPHWSWANHGADWLPGVGGLPPLPADDQLLTRLLSHAGALAPRARLALPQARTLPTRGPLAQRFESAVALQNRGDFAGAAKRFQALAKEWPNCPPILQNLGVCLSETKADREAESALRRLAGVAPTLANAWLALCKMAARRQATLEMVRDAERARQLAPDSSSTHYELGYAFHMRGDLERAEQHFAEAARLDPVALLPAYQFACVLAMRGKNVEAASAFEQIVVRFPDHARAWHDLAGIYLRLARSRDAEVAARRAITLDPEYFSAYNSLGVALTSQGKPEEAIEAYRQSLIKYPDRPAIHNNLGNLYFELKKLQEALDAYEEALRLDPGFAEAHCNYASLLKSAGDYAAAMKHFQRAIDLEPEYSEPYRNAGLTALDLHADFALGIPLMQEALRISPTDLGNNSVFMFGINYHPDITQQQLFEAYTGWQKRCMVEHGDRYPRVRPGWDGARRLRIGYISPDFRRHSARFFITPLLSHHRRENVELFCYAQLFQADEDTERFQAMSDHWRVVTGMSDEQVAELIRRDRLDVLVDLAGHTTNNRLACFVYRPAPVQISYLGYGYTTGMPCVDYFMATEEFVPDGNERYFTEDIWRLPHTTFCYAPPAGMPETNELPALKNGYVTFGCYSRAIRFNYKMIRLWAELLKRVPNSRLMLNTVAMYHEGNRDYFADQFARHGIGRDRLYLTFTQPQSVTWSSYREIDIMLDTAPHNTGATLFESLWMGVPAVSIRDRAPLGRFGDAIMGPLGLKDWVASSEEEYVAIAARWATDLSGLAEVRRGLRERMRISPICDGAAFAADLENAYAGMVRRADAERTIPRPEVN